MSPMDWIGATLAKYPELAVYLALGAGFLVGRIRVMGFSLGGTTGALLAGIVVGLLFKVPVSSAAKSLVFLLFLFGIGYDVGPKFFKAMKGEGWRFAVLGAFIPVVGLLTAWVVARELGLDPGYAAGLLSGGLTESPAMGTASEAIGALPIADDLKALFIAHIGVADAICYVGGALGVIIMCGTVGPRLLRIDLRAEALKIEAEYGITRTRAGVSPAWRPFTFRAYKLLPGARVAGRTVADAERLVSGARLFVLRIRRGAEFLDATPATVLEVGDVVAIGARREVLLGALGESGAEVDDPELLDIPVASFDVFVSKPGIDGQTLEQIARSDLVRGVFLRGITRRAQQIPIGQRTVVERGDVLRVVGPEAAVSGVAEAVGELVAPTEITDFATVSLAIVVGSLVGIAAAARVAGVSISIGSSVGTLIAGVLVGYVRSRRPIFGRVPDGAIQFMQTFGLAAFVAMVGIGAGPHFVAAIREAGVGLLCGGLIVTAVPQVAGLYVGRYVLKINPVLLLGALAGAQTFTPGLAEVQQKSGSPIAVLGYSGAVPVGHVLLTTWGTVIVMLIAN